MSNFVIELDPNFPDRLVYLGVGQNERGERLAIFAVQLPRDSDVIILTQSTFSIGWAIGQKKLDDSPYRAFEEALLRRAEGELNSPISPQFTVDEKNHTVTRNDGQEIIAAPAPTEGYKPPIAICEVRNTTEHYVPSWGMPDPASGRCHVYRRSGPKIGLT